MPVTIETDYCMYWLSRRSEWLCDICSLKLASLQVQQIWLKRRINRGTTVKLLICQRVLMLSGKHFIWYWEDDLVLIAWCAATGAQPVLLLFAKCGLSPITSYKSCSWIPTRGRAPPWSAYPATLQECRKIADDLMIFSTDVLWYIGWLCAFS